MKRIDRAGVATIVLGVALCVALGSAAPALAAEASISGRVIDAETELGIEGVEVCASGGNFGPWGGCGFSGAGGNYEIADVPPGSYLVKFAEESQSLNYLPQTYDANPEQEGTQALAVDAGEEIEGVDAALLPGGQITGKVTDAVTGLSVEGVHVCASPDIAGYEGVINCAHSDGAGEYTVHSLPTGSYTLEFFVEGSPNYIRQYYPGRAAAAEAEAVAVVAGATRSGLNAAMQPGIQITGTITEAGTGSPIKWIGICAWRPSTETRVACAGSEPGGAYSIAGLPLGSYVVGFAVDSKEDGVVLHPDGYVRQYYDHKATFAAADLVGGPVSAVYTGIDAALTQGPEVWPEEAVPIVPPIGRPVVRRPSPVKCRKGFHRKSVKGKSRCVRKAKKHRHHRPGTAGRRPSPAR
jgi:hypothetical protein